MPLHHKVPPPPFIRLSWQLGRGSGCALIHFVLQTLLLSISSYEPLMSKTKTLSLIVLYKLHLLILFCILTPWKNLTEVWKLVHHFSFMANIFYQIIPFKNFQSTIGKQLVNRSEFLFRWGFSPLDEAVRFDHQACVDLIKRHLQLQGKTIQ